GQWQVARTGTGALTELHRENHTETKHTGMPKPPTPDKAPSDCGKGCIAALLLILVLLILLLVFYEPTPTAGDMCKIYG
ncbi:MAG TPA: hypothetical protein VIC30_09875, partial [Orrella sp.]